MHFSIVIPLYNKSKYVERCINSILKQSFSDFEIVVVDDCSKDDSVLKIQSFHDKRIRLFLNEHNRGPSFTRNTGIRNAQGNYIVFLDADDYVQPGYLEIVKNATLSYPDIHVFGVGIKLGTGASVNVSGSWSIYPRYSYHDQACRGRMVLTSSSSCCERSTFDQVGLFDESARYVEDPELWVRVSSCYEMAYYSGELVIYDIDVENSLSQLGRQRSFIPIILDTLNVQYQQSRNKKAYMLYARYLITYLCINRMASSPKAIFDALDEYASRLSGFDIVRYKFFKLFGNQSLIALYRIFRFIKYKVL